LVCRPEDDPMIDKLSGPTEAPGLIAGAWRYQFGGTAACP
jgi:hypothetical protein